MHGHRWASRFSRRDDTLVASYDRPYVSNQSTNTTGENMKRRNLLTAFAWSAASLALAAPLAQTAQAADAPGVAFVYLGNPGDAGWTFAHDQGSKEAEAKFGNKIKITRIE